jgi:hypothetical protein
VIIDRIINDLIATKPDENLLVSCLEVWQPVTLMDLDNPPICFSASSAQGDVIKRSSKDNQTGASCHYFIDSGQPFDFVSFSCVFDSL